MREVFSAMRRSLMSLVTASASARRAARRRSRSVLRTGMQPSRKDSCGIMSSDVMTRGSRVAFAIEPQKRGHAAKAKRGAGIRSPLMEPHFGSAGLTGMPADLDMVGRLFGCCLRHRDHRHVDAAFGFGAELDVTVHQGEQGVI